MSPSLFRLDVGAWYALERHEPDARTLAPYCTPIRVDRVEPLRSGRGVFRLTFFKANYPEGVQHSIVDLRVLRRTEGLLIGTEQAEWNRVYLIGSLSTSWLERCLPLLAARVIGEGADIDEYLCREFGGSPR